MSLKVILAATAVSLAFGIACGSAFAADAIPSYVTAAVKYYGRPPLEMERDGALKPAEIMAFAGVKPGMKVIDLRPVGGYYTRVVSKIVGSKGQVYAVVPETRNGAGSSDLLVKEIDHDMPVSETELAYSLVDQPEYKNIGVYREGLGENLYVPQQVDFVITHDYHVFKSSEFAKVDMAKVNKGIFDTMKSGGVYVVIDNAANKGTGFSDATKLNRTDADAVKAEVLAAGFTFDGESDVLARSNDDHTKPADDLLVGGNEAMKGTPADMFVLRFKKPLNAPNTDHRPPNLIKAVAGYFGNTRRGQVGLTGNVSGQRERRVMYHSDGNGGVLYEEMGAHGTGRGAFQAGTLFYAANGEACMLHIFPEYSRGSIACSFGRAAPYKKAGDTWVDENHTNPTLYPKGLPYKLVPGLAYFDK